MWNQFWQFQNLDNHSIFSFVNLGKIFCLQNWTTQQRHQIWHRVQNIFTKVPLSTQTLRALRRVLVHQKWSLLV